MFARKKAERERIDALEAELAQLRERLEAADRDAAALRTNLTDVEASNRSLATRLASICEQGEELTDRLDTTVLTQGELPKPALLDRFSEEPETSLFATMSFWQGVDVQGDALRNVIIMRLPFSVPDQPLLQARLHAAPLARGHRARNDVEGPGTVDVLAFAVDGEGHAHLGNGPFGRFLATAELAGAQG